MSKQVGKSPFVSNVVRWSIVASAFSISLTLVISWILWITMYRTTVDNALIFFGNKTLAQGYGINFDFLILSIISLGVALIAFLFAFPLVFYRKKTGFTVFISLLNFILAALILVAAILFIMTSYNFYGDFYNVFGTKKLLIVFLPWLIVIVLDLFLLFNSLWSLISSANGVNFVPTVETEAKAQYQELNTTPVVITEKIITPTETIIIPTAPAPIEPIITPPPVLPTETNNEAKEVTNETPKIEDKNEIIIPDSQVTVVEPEPAEKVVSTSQLAPFAVYQENEYGAYVLLKDHTSPTNNELEKPNASNNTINLPATTPVIEESTKTEEEAPKIEDHPKTKETHHEKHDPQIRKVGRRKLKGFQTPKIEELAPIVANPPAPEIEKPKEKVKPISNWTTEQIDEIWNKAQVITDVNPKLYRKDYAGAWMFRDAFTTVLEETNVRSYAWTIVNHRPLAHDGDNSIDNLDPMNVTNAITKGEDYPKWKTKISSSGNENIVKEQSWKARI